MEELETVPYGQLSAAYLRAYRELVSEKGIPFFAPLVNEDYPGDPMKVGFTENAKKIPVMVGSTFAEFSRSEYRSRHVSDEEMVKIICNQYGDAQGNELIRAFKEAHPTKNLTDIYAADVSDFRYETKKWVAKRVEEEAAPTYSYLFTLESPFNGGTPAGHCSDIPFFFHNVDKVPIVNIEGVSDRLCDQMFNAFMNFARTGNPETPLLPEWGKCTKGDEVTMIFDETCEARHNFDTDFVKIYSDCIGIKSHFAEDAQK